MDDPFIRSYIGELLRSLRTQYLIDLIKPYTRMELSFLAKVRNFFRSTGIANQFMDNVQQLNVDIQEVEELLIGLILEGKVEGRIDQVGMRLELDRKYAPAFLHPFLLTIYSRQSLEKKRYAALQKWSENLEAVHSAIIGKTNPSSRGDPSAFADVPFGARD